MSDINLLQSYTIIASKMNLIIILSEEIILIECKETVLKENNIDIDNL